MENIAYFCADFIKYVMDTKIITEFEATEVVDFFMKSEQYHDFELPKYLDFSSVLDFVRTKVGTDSYADCVLTDPSTMPDANIEIVLNKDGHYGVRPLLLANPYLYYFLVRELTDNWEFIQACFEQFKVPTIEVGSLPVYSDDRESFHRSHTILNWWRSMEQASIELALEYRYMFVTDITNCYGSIDPQTYHQAFRFVDERLNSTRSHLDSAAAICQLVSALQRGRNVGIPQGSTLFDLLAEIVLGYSDVMLHQAIKDKGITSDYKILRYRDDYRVFCNSRADLEEISYILQNVLNSLNMRMNTSKTLLSSDIVLDSIKKDKRAYIFNTPIRNANTYHFDSYQKQLLFILMFGRKYPNSGRVAVLLAELNKRMADNEEKCKRLLRKLQSNVIIIYGDEPDEKPETEPKTAKKSILSSLKQYSVKGRWLPLGGTVEALVSIATQIAIENITRAHYALRIVSRLITYIEDEKQQYALLQKVRNCFGNLHNSEYIQIWLQNLTYRFDPIGKDSPYKDVRLCSFVNGCEKQLWNNSWLKPKYTADFNAHKALKKELLERIEPVLSFRESPIYDDDFDEYQCIADAITEAEEKEQRKLEEFQRIDDTITEVEEKEQQRKVIDFLSEDKDDFNIPEEAEDDR